MSSYKEKALATLCGYLCAAVAFRLSRALRKFLSNPVWQTVKYNPPYYYTDKGAQVEESEEEMSERVMMGVLGLPGLVWGSQDPQLHESYNPEARQKVSELYRTIIR